MKTQRTFSAVTAVVFLSFAVDLTLYHSASQAATPSFAPAAKHGAALPVNVRIQQALQQELQQRARQHDLNVARIHHEFALKDAEIRRMHKVLMRKDAEIKHLRAALGQPSGG